MRRYQKLFLLTVMSLTLLLPVWATHPGRPTPAPLPAKPRFSVEFRSSPDGANVEYWLSGGIVGDTIRWFRGDGHKNSKTNEPNSFILDDGTTITSVFTLAGYQECRAESLIKDDARGRRLEVRYVRVDQNNQRHVTDGPVLPLNSADSRNPAIIMCSLER